MAKPEVLITENCKKCKGTCVVGKRREPCPHCKGSGKHQRPAKPGE